MTLTKLDGYDFMVLPGVIRVKLEGTNDPSMVDILSELERSNGRVYLDGSYYDYLGYDIRSYSDTQRTYLDLLVVLTNKEG